MDTRTAYEVLENKLALTKAARFEAYRRLKARATLSTYTLSIVSGYLMVISLQPFLKTYEIIPPEYVESFSLVTSIFMLILSLLESGNDYSTQAEHFHYSGKIINKLYSDLRNSKSMSTNGQELNSKIVELSKEYHQHIMGCPVNAEPIDDELAYIQDARRNKKGIKWLTNLGWYFIAQIKLYFMYGTAFYMMFILIPPVVVIILWH